LAKRPVKTGTKAALIAASATSWRMRLGITATEAKVLSCTLTPKAFAVRISRATPTTREMPVAAATMTAAQASLFCRSVTRYALSQAVRVSRHERAAQRAKQRLSLTDLRACPARGGCATITRLLGSSSEPRPR
jgi:hypothetical protein